MNYEVRLTSGAVKDLENIQEYIAKELLNPASAQKVTSDILKKCRTLSLAPKQAPARCTVRGLALRFVHLHHYAVVYSVDDQKKQVTVRTVIYSHRDIAKLIQAL